jgi:hypothetical protein
MLQEQKYETKITNDIVKNKTMTKEEKTLKLPCKDNK